MKQQHVYQSEPAAPALLDEPNMVLPLPPLYSRRQRRRQQRLLLARRMLYGFLVFMCSLAALFSVLAGLLMWLVAARSHDRREAWRWLVVLALFCGMAYTGWLWQSSPLPGPWHSIILDFSHHLWKSVLMPLVQIWTANILLAPLVALVLAFLYPHRKRPMPQPPLKEMSLQEYEQAARAEQAGVTQALVSFAEMTSPEPQRGLVALAPISLVLEPAAARREVLGTYERGELIEMIEAGQFCLTSDLMRMHGVILGEPSYGKTTTLIRLLAIARRLGRKVIFLDLKGSRKTAALFLAAMKMLNTPRVRMYPREAMDGWRGGPQALFNRLMEQIDPKTHPFYRSGVGSTVVALAVNAPSGPPRNSYEFLARLDTTWLKRAYATDAQAQREIKAVSEHLNGLALVFSGFFRGIGGALDGGWSFEDTDSCYIGIDGTAHKEEAATLGRYILEDAAHYATSRKDPDDQVTFIIDEFGVLRSTNATDLYERVREAGMSIFVGAQSYESLGPERNSLLSAAAIKILHRTGAPEPIVKFAGEREIPQFSRYIGGAGGSEAELLPASNRPGSGERPDTIMRQQKEYAVTVEEVQQLGLGQIAFLFGGEGAFIKVTPLAVPGSLEQAARRFLAASPPFTPLPPPKAEPKPKAEQRPRERPTEPKGEREQPPESERRPRGRTREQEQPPEPEPISASAQPPEAGRAARKPRARKDGSEQQQAKREEQTPSGVNQENQAELWTPDDFFS